jgi:hypothetical protein
MLGVWALGVWQIADEYASVRDLPADFQIAPASTTSAAAVDAPRTCLTRAFL